MELESLFQELQISNKKKELEFTREIFRYIIAFSLAITKPKYDIAFSSNRVSEIYEKIKYYYYSYDFDNKNDISKILFFPCLYSMNEICYCLNDFQNSFGYKNYIENNNISKTFFADMTSYIIDCFMTPCCENYYTNWTQEQINVLFYIIEYINTNWIDIGDINKVVECDKFDFFFYESQICV